MVKILNETEFSEAIATDGIKVVDFFATWCGPCKMLAPVLDELAEDFAGKVDICKVDIDESMNIARKYRVMSVPTVMIFKNSEAVETIVGYNDKEEFAKLIEKHL